jgi:myo-inositol 2-dehydrogenase/D-chiro-inositol 1-dehydrogenase
MTRKVKLGIIGAGRIGRIHAENLALRVSEAEVLAITDTVQEAAESCASDFHIPQSFKDYHRILNDSRIEAIVICSSTDTHVSLIEQAASAGKHIFCEKPIALDLAAIDRALGAVEKAGVILQVGFQRRFDPNFRRAHELISQGAVGRPHILRITSRDPEPPPINYVKVSGGIFLDMTIHDFDMARYIMGEEVEEVYSAGSVLINQQIGEAGDVDTAVVILRFKSGAIGVIDNSRKAVYGYDQRLEVFGEKGKIVVENPKPDTTVVSNEQGYHSSPLFHFFVERYTDSYVAEMKAFVECICSDREPLVTGLDGKISVVIGYAAKRSCEEHRPVRLTEIDSGLAGLEGSNLYY